MGVDRVWPLYLITGQKKNISVYPCSYPCVSAVKKREERERRDGQGGREEREKAGKEAKAKAEAKAEARAEAKGAKGLLTLIKADEKSKDQSGWRHECLCSPLR